MAQQRIDPAQVKWDTPATPAPAAGQAAAPTPTPPVTGGIDPASIKWDSPDQMGFVPPPSTAGLPALPKTGPKNLFFDTIVPMVTEATGAVIGASAAGRAVKAVGTGAQLFTRALGAGLGGATAGAAADATSATPPLGPPPSVAGRLETASHRFVGNALGEAAAPGVSDALRAVRNLPVRALAARTRATLKPGAQEAIDYMGGRVTPGQVSRSPFLQLIENVVGGSMFGRGRLSGYLAEQEAQLTRQADQLIEQFGERATREEAGAAIKGAQVQSAVEQSGQRVASTVTRGRETIGAARGGVEQARGGLTAAQQEFDRLQGEVRRAVGPAAGLERTGEMNQRLIELAHKQAKEAASAMYDEIDELSQGVQVPLQPIADFVSEEFQRRGALSVNLRGGKAASTLKAVERGTAPAGDDVVEDAATSATQRLVESGRVKTSMDAARASGADTSYADTIASLLAEEGISPEQLAGSVNFRQAHELRSAFGRLIRDANKRGDNQLRGVATQLQERIDTAMREAAGADSALLEQYDAATRAWKTMARTFEDGVIAKAAEAHPAKFLQTVMGPEGSVADIHKVRETLGPEGWRTVQAQAWQELSHAPEGTPLSPKEFLRTIKNTRIETLRALFGDTTDTIAGMRPAAGGVLAAESGVRRAEVALGKATTAAEGAVGKAQSAGQAAVRSAQEANEYTLVSKSLDTATGTDIRKLRILVGDDGWHKVQSLKAQELFGLDNADPSRVPGQRPTLRTGRKLQEALPKQEQLKEIFPEDQANFLHQFARVTAQLEGKKELGAIGQFAIQMAQPGALTGLPSGILTGNIPLAATSGVILITPSIMARMITAPEMRRALLQGVGAAARGDAGTGARVATQMAQWLMREGLIGRDGKPVPVGAPPAPPTGRGPGRVGAPPAAAGGRGPGPLAGPPVAPR